MKKEEYSGRRLLRDLISFIRPYKRKFLFATLARLCGDIVWLYPPYALAAIVTFLSTWTDGASPRPLYIIFSLWSGAIVIRLLSQYLSRTRGFAVAEQISLDTQARAIEHLYHLDISWHEKENAGNKMKRIDRGIEAMDKLARVWFNSFIEIVVVLTGMTFIIGSIDPLISLASVIFTISFYAISRHFLKKATAAAREVNAKEEELSGLLFEGISNIRTAKVLNMTPSLMKLIRKMSLSVMEKISKRIARFQERNALLGVWTNAFRIIMFIIIIRGIIEGNYEVGFLLIFYGYFSRVQESINELSDAVEAYVTSKQSVGRMVEILETPIYKNGIEGKKDFPKDWKTISLKNVNFSYGDEQILHDISFDIRRGERIGIVGSSGAGKSTLFKLLLKENEGYSGEISIDETPLKKIKKDAYYNNATVVLQETEVFNFSLKENITIANPSRANDKASLKKALNISHVSPFVSRLPFGLETLIGEKGVKLSGGEKQRVGIARAVFKEPDILFLDEATSHLDLESEEKIRDSLHVFFQQVTAIVIAHRLTTVKEMDRILVMEKGRVVESGSFAELYEKRGRFYDLWEKQKLD